MRQNADFLVMVTLMSTKLAECEAECVELQNHINRDHTYMDEQTATICELRDRIESNDRYNREVVSDLRTRLHNMEDRNYTLQQEVIRLKEAAHKALYGGETIEETANAYMAKEGASVCEDPKRGKIACIKVVRDTTGWGLKESKDFVEAYMTRLATLKDEEVGSGTKRSQQLPNVAMG